MTLQDFAHVLRSRWLIICASIVVAVLAAGTLTFLTTPLYEGSTRLFVSTRSADSASEIYSGTLSSQQRVLSYTKLLVGETLAQRAIDKLQLPMTAEDLQKKIQASSPPDTVLIDVTVLDSSPERARDIAEVLSEEFVVMLKELETPEEGARPDVRVVIEQHASIPTKPVIPKTTRNLTLGLAMGVLLGLGLALLRDRLDRTVKDQQTLEEITGVGVVASIPLDKDRNKHTAISFATEHSAMAEAFRGLRTNLQFLEVDDPPRVLVIASSMPGEGKSTTAINIALALAEAEHNVVLVDGDMRRPKVAEYLGLIGSVGFSTVLAGQASLHEVLQKTRFPGLTALTSGPIPPNPSELLGTKAAQKVLGELRVQFDYVIVDSSPLLPVTDGVILAAASDGVLVIGRFAKTKRDQLGHAVDNLRNVGAPILGAVLTMIPARKDDPTYYGYYSDAEKPSSTLQRTPPRAETPKRRNGVAESNAANRLPPSSSRRRTPR